MARKNNAMVRDLESDPFGERSATQVRGPLQLLGGRFRFDSNSSKLLRLVDLAYANLPRHRLSATVPELRIKLLLQTSRHARSRLAPPPIAMLHGADLLGGATDSSNCVLMSPREGSALVVVTREMLRFAYHTRYDLIEFAVFTLAARTQGLVPLHAACVGQGGRGILLMGPSGAGKTTVALHCLLEGLDFLAEDAAFVTPDTLLATGVANFLHVRADSLRWLGRSREAAMIRKSPVIRRRSGIKKFEVDLRRDAFRLAMAPLRIVGVVFLSSQSSGDRPLLRSLPKSTLLANLALTQAYGTSQPQWRAFSSNLSRLDAFELRRGRHPLEAVQILRDLLANR